MFYDDLVMEAAPNRTGQNLATAETCNQEQAQGVAQFHSELAMQGVPVWPLPETQDQPCAVVNMATTVGASSSTVSISRTVRTAEDITRPTVDLNDAVRLAAGSEAASTRDVEDTAGQAAASEAASTRDVEDHAGPSGGDGDIRRHGDTRDDTESTRFAGASAVNAIAEEGTLLAASRHVEVEAHGGGASGDSTARLTPTGSSPLPGADRLAGLLGEAEALLRDTAITAAMAAAAANEPDPFLDGLLAAVGSAPGDLLARAAAPDALPGELAGAEALLDAVDGFLGATGSHRSSVSPLDLPGEQPAVLLAEVPGLGVSNWVGFVTPREAQPAPRGPMTAGQGAVGSHWVSDARRWHGDDLGAQLDGICRELDDIVGLSTARGRELDDASGSRLPPGVMLV